MKKTDDEMMDSYADIIMKKRPHSRHPRMDVAERARIFAPFAALKGYEDAIRNVSAQSEELSEFWE